MATGNDIVNGAVRKLGIKPSEEPLEPSDLQDAIEVMNDMLIEWENSGIVLGFAPIANSADTVRIPRGTEDCVKANLAGRLAPEYDIGITAELSANIQASTENMLRLIARPLDVEFPDSLPIGQGNQCIDVFNDQRFFSQNSEENF